MDATQTEHLKIKQKKKAATDVLKQNILPTRTKQIVKRNDRA